jgi:hypothetical protein
VITAYAAKRPTGEWSLMLINKDPTNAHEVKIEFGNAGSAVQYFAGQVAMVTFGADQYVWRPAGSNSHADPDGPPNSTWLNVRSDERFTLPRASVTVLRGNLGSE